MSVRLIPLPRGEGNPVNLVGSPADDFCVIQKYSFIYVLSNDNMCIAKSLILAITPNTPTAAELKSLMNNDTLLTIKALENLQNFTITVYNSRNVSRTIFGWQISDDRVILNLYLENNHYSVIKTLTGAFSAPFLRIL
ncbi:hypothetical protein WA026_010775 [Henosepilachna vigintioctopunctata]|uniref:Uncharacterized protein n=1 Tax=Henosepilachna vigintioctopunctata TaxID=420089 RepID=A0AAW1URX8_9CUCU